MKRTESIKAVSIILRSALPSALGTAILLLAVLLSVGCTAGPKPSEEPPSEPDPVLMERAGQLIQGASPEQLRQAVQMLEDPARSSPAAQELASFAVALFDLLYPQLAESDYLAAGSIPPYRGAYSRTLDRARAGQPPLSGVPSQIDAEEDFFALVVPALFVSRMSDPAAVSPAELSGYLKTLDQARKLNRSSALPPYLQGRIRELEGDPDRAATLYQESLNRAASFYPTAQAMAVLLLKKGQAEQAATLLEQIAGQLPQIGSIRYPLAEAYYKAGQLEAAAATVAKVLLEDPDRPDALLLRARVLAAEGNWNQALRLLNLLLYQHPDSQEAYLLAAQLRYEEAVDPEGALELLSEAENQFPEAAEFPELAGRIYLDTGRDGEGLNQLQRALDLDPGRVSTLRLLLANAMDMQRWLQSAIYLSEILEQEQSEQDLLQAIQIYRSLGDPAQVLYYAEQLYKGNPSVENLVVYAQSLLAEDRVQQAADLVEQGLEQAQTPELHGSLLTLQASMTEDPDEALALVREALLENPHNYQALVKITELYVDQRELRKASLYLKQAIALDPNNAALRVQLQSIEKALGTQD